MTKLHFDIVITMFTFLTLFLCSSTAANVCISLGTPAP